MSKKLPITTKQFAFLVKLYTNEPDRDGGWHWSSGGQGSLATSLIKKKFISKRKFGYATYYKLEPAGLALVTNPQYYQNFLAEATIISHALMEWGHLFHKPRDYSVLNHFVEFRRWNLEKKQP